jgi:hypothetical protein
LHAFTLIDQVTDLINALPPRLVRRGRDGTRLPIAVVSISRVTLMLTSSPTKR